MRKLHLALLTLAIVLVLPVGTAHAQVNCEKECNENDTQVSTCLEEKIACLEDNLTETRAKKSTLENEISIINGSINIQQAKISQTKNEIAVLEREITDLDNRISGLSISLDRLSTLLVERVRTQYKREQIDPISFVASSKSLADFMSQFRYLRLAGQQTAQAMQKAENQRSLYDEQKDLKEIKQIEVEAKRAELQSQQNTLVGQRQQQQDLLSSTKNDEQKFQQMLAIVKAEYEAIQAIISKKGSDTLVGQVTKGTNIASIIQGASCNSGGSHLHFTIIDASGKTLNPFNYLKDIDHVNCSGPGSCSSGDEFNPSGSWEWPIDATIKFTQGYGSTWATRNTWVGNIYNFHNGIDINSTSSSKIKTVADGTLYRGSYTGSGGCRLRYVRIDHNEGGLSSLYLHVNY